MTLDHELFPVYKEIRLFLIPDAKMGSVKQLKCIKCGAVLPPAGQTGFITTTKCQTTCS